MYKFLIIIEKTDKNYSAYAPELPGCVATGKTVEEVENNMYDAIEMHLDGLKEDNSPIPPHSALAEYVVIKD
ncbi:MAG TPA: type II toxin-antitoxin system HicB family antitoxin [Methanofastidiosum sp.]|nr:type II toxin-antitoxin system HicB family antitoxin [Methanofastidiosum sp.]HPA49696.1 type II toxin-antitoxin system HicB family antitoxin [Methanofastidiosum sp.]HQK62603.1 type II toxin-antitoxin system HicB family antitoxin [Methanofastidiosum sp.]HQQ49386.1 type II toxin-antitoxin system HicB family antitoxin [Methanofastidiosum sp.]